MRVHILVGIALSVGFVGLGILFSVQASDPAGFFGAIPAAAIVWVAVLIYHVLTVGFPIRIVADERLPPR
jgi:hypothetical protein